ncbi:MAG: tetratricopeptide repeat protein [Alicyclobacillus sp.]|nr:tetratricopeptide repeat protein [Alicyclobacillus sp.]
MGKLLLFYALWRLTAHPVLFFVVVLFVVLYFVDLRYIGLLPSIAKPFRRMSRVSQLRRQLQVNPHDAPAKYDLAQTYMEARRYREALVLLRDLPPSMQTTPDVQYDTGVCQLRTGNLEVGKSAILSALAAQPRLRYGKPYLQLAAVLADAQPAEAMAYLDQFRQQNASSCEGEYRAAMLHLRLGHKDSAKEALHRCLDTFRALPRFRKRGERRWAIRARLKLFTM